MVDMPDRVTPTEWRDWMNRKAQAGRRVAQPPAEKKPSACVGCRSCEAVCPQQIKISEALADFSSKLGLRETV